MFDCDGVLADSEPITNGVLRQMLNEAGWALTQAECEHIFIGQGRARRAHPHRAGNRPPAHRRLDACLTPGATSACVPNSRRWTVPCAVAARTATPAVHCLCVRRRPAKVVMQIEMAACAVLGDRIFSGHDRRAPNPRPDVYLAAAAHVGVHPARCLVIEDTATGVCRSGCRCHRLGLLPRRPRPRLPRPARGTGVQSHG